MENTLDFMTAALKYTLKKVSEAFIEEDQSFFSRA